MDVAFNQEPQLPACMRLLPIQHALLNDLFYTAITQGYAEPGSYCHYMASVDISSTLKLNHGLRHTSEIALQWTETDTKTGTGISLRCLSVCGIVKALRVMLWGGRIETLIRVSSEMPLLFHVT